MKKLFLLMLSLVAFCAASAQVTTSGMNGTVTDENGDPLVGATVIAVHTPSGTTYGVVSNANGYYNLQGLRAGGPYKLTVSFVGYQSVEFTDLQLQLGETLTRNAYLRDNQEIEVVVVTGDGKNSAMNINRAGAGTSVSEKQIAMLPSVSRSLNDVMKLTPQASTTTSGLAIGGGNYRQSYVTVDGASFNNMFGIGSNLPAGGSPISLDALEQVSVAVTPYDVRQSGFTGGAINAVTKSGTNDLKISVYDYYKSDAWTGSRYKDEGKLSLSQSINNTLGVSVGAPIVKNKLFIFANFEREWNKTPGITRLARTSEDQTWGGSSQYNRPTVEQMETMKNFLQEKYGYNPGRYADYSLKVPNWKFMTRVDWNINQNHSLNVRYSETRNKYSASPSSSVNPLNNPLPYDRNNAGRGSYCAMTYESARYYQEQNFTSVAAELNSRFLDGKLTNTLRYTYSHQYEPRSFEGGLFPTVDILQDGDLLTTFGIDPFTYGNLREVNTHIVTDEIGWNSGINHFTFGYQFEHDTATNGYMQGGAGYYVYNSWDDFVNDRAPLAFTIMHSNRNDLQQQFPSFSYMQHSIYAQDELSISSRFKATIGLRLEVPVYPSIANNENKEFTELFANRGGYKTSDMPKARLNVSPRVGFNWDMTGERKYILRGGTGIFTGRLPFVWIVSAVGNSNVMQAQSIYQVGDPRLQDLKFHDNINDILENLYGGQFEAGELRAPTQTTIMDTSLKMPSTWKSSLALDMKLPGDVNFNIEGIYNKDINSVAVRKLGIEEVEGGIQMPGEPGVRKLWKSSGIKNSAGESVTPYLIHNTDIDGYYASLTAQVSKEWKFGLSLSAAYTYASSKNVIDGIGDQVTSAYNTNTFCKDGSNTPQLGYSSYVSPHRILLNVGYRLTAPKSATTFGLFYEAYRLGYIGSYTYSRYSYTMTNMTGDGGADMLLYVPTREQLGEMTFAKEGQKEAFWEFINKDQYLKKHIGEYTERGGAVMPWRHELNFKFAHDFYFNVKGKRNALTVGVDVNNIANLINRNWGNVEQISTNRILTYKSGVYTFTEPQWSVKASTASTWSALLSIRYTFN